jgi:hypothetical protein
MRKPVLISALVLATLLISPVVAVTTTQQIAPGDRLVVQCETTLTVGAELQQATLDCAPTPVPFVRSIPGQTTMVNFLLAHPEMIGPGDAFGLLVGGGTSKVTAANATWVNTQADRLRAAYPGHTVFAQTSGTCDVKTLANGSFAHIDAISLVLEPNYGTECEPWSTSQSVLLGYIARARGYAEAKGLDLVLHVTGRGVSWRDGWWPSYAPFAAALNPSAGPNVLQSQADFKSAYLNGNDRVDRVVCLVNQQVPTWLPQVTISTTETNGVPTSDAAEGLLANAIATCGAPRGISVWSLNAGSEFQRFLQATLPWTVR